MTEVTSPDPRDGGRPAKKKDPPPVVILRPEELTPYLQRTGLREVGRGGGPSVWSVSSAKHGNGVSCVLCAEDLTQYWQSDGVLPHTLTIELSRLTPLQQAAVYLDFKQDESYTPREIRVKVGTHRGDMEVVATAVVDQPEGWVMLDLRGEPAPSTPSPADPAELAAEEEARRAEESYWGTRIELLFSENHHNGRDCHIRGVRLLGPREEMPFEDPLYAQHYVLR